MRIFNIQKYIFILVSVLLIVFSCVQVTPLFAEDATVEELQQKIDERNKNIEKLNKEIQTYKELTDKTSKEAISLQKTIRQLEQNGKALNLDIKKTSAKIDVTNLDIKRLNINIQTSEQKIKKYQDGLEVSIREIQRSEDGNYISSILGSNNISDFLGQVESQLSFNNAIQNQVEIIKGEKRKLEVNKNSKESNKQELVKLQSELSNKKKAVDYTKSEQNKILIDTKSQEKNFQKLLKDRVALKNAVEKEMFEYEAKLKYKLNPSSIPQSGSRPLSWPVDNVRITQKFGAGPAARKLYVSGSHNGVDFGARIGTPVKAVLSGTVIGTGDTDKTCPRTSFGRWVLIKHDNGLASIVAHLSVISATQGQVVKTGDIIGYSGNTGYSTGPHVHLTVYAADAVKVQQRPSASCAGKVFTMPIAPIEAYLDPLLYLPTN